MKNFSNKFAQYLFYTVFCSIVILLFNNCSEASFETAQAAGDPLIKYAWHLRNTGQKVFAEEAARTGVDLNLLETWSSGISGKGIRILISDDGVEDSHEDLRANFMYGNLSKDYTKAFPYAANSSPPLRSSDNHGTSVAGLVAAVANNGHGSRGVAFGSSIAATNFLSEAVSLTESTLIDQATGDFDIFNYSWGSVQNTLDSQIASFHSQLYAGVTNRRNGKGAVYIKAAGNNFFVGCQDNEDAICVGNSGMDSDNSSPYLILVGALNAVGGVASYSSSGANIWVSSFGGEFGDDSPAMMTTDRLSCSKGFSQSGLDAGSLAFERGLNENSGCNYSVSFNGTSSAAPLLSGVAALLLEANPKLTWRDVKYILAKSAKIFSIPAAATNVHPAGDILPVGVKWDYGTTLNAAGFTYHVWLGLGQVNVDAAIALAKAYTFPLETYREYGYVASVSSGVAIPESMTPGSTLNINIPNNVKLESVQLRLNIVHTNIGDLGIEVESPSGTKSMFMNVKNSLKGLTRYNDFVLQGNAFYQESSVGTWKVRVINAGAGTGTINSVALRVTGGSN